MKKTLLLLSLFAILPLFGASPKYVFLFIGDGMSTPQRMVAEEFSRAIGNGPLAMNALPYQATTRTCSADSLVTDSAAAATAIACGIKTNNHFSGVDPNGKPVYSCAVSAKKAGKKVGILTTVTLTHATPAGFYAHRRDRGNMNGIAEDLAASGFDLFAGGGLATGDDKWNNAVAKGYKLVTSKDEFLALKPGCGKILTRFRNDALPDEIDSDGSTPSLAEMVRQAIKLLYNDKGFFVMAEGGRIDWAGHANDAATNLREVLAFDEAIKVALSFQRKHPNETLIIVTGDHETGGLSMGFSGTGYAIYPKRLGEQKMSVAAFQERLRKLRADKGGTLDWETAKAETIAAFGFSGNLNDLENAYKGGIGKLAEACRVRISHESGLGWSTIHHTAMPVLTTSQGVGAEKFTGFIENTDIAKLLKAFYE